MNDQVKEEIERFIEDFEKSQISEEKLKISISFMKSAISKEGDPDFKGFWEAKKRSLIVFKDPLRPFIRLQFWKQYVDLVSQAKKLKKILEEKICFEVEQIEIAIEELKKEVENFNDILEKMVDVDFPKSEFIDYKKDEYKVIQKNLNLLNTFAARVNMLRKEILKMDIRVSIKSKFLKRLSIIGNEIFPKRKDLIKKISQQFLKDIEEFVEVFLVPKKYLLYILKNEIKALQSLAKILTINTKTFSQVRLKLSKWWDKIKVLEKQNLQDKKKNYERVKEEVNKLLEDSKNLSLKELENGKIKILKFMRTVNLSKVDVDKLKKNIDSILSPAQQEIQRLEQEKIKKIQKKRDEIERIKGDIQKLIEKEEVYDIEEISEEKEKIINSIEALDLNKIEKQVLDRVLRPLKDIIIKKKEKALLELSEDQIKSIKQMKQILIDRENRKREIKKQIEKYRKALGGSGFDFEQAMMHRKMLDIEKERLGKIDKSIMEIKEKIEKIEKG
ncbi:MAG: hypothetical protein AMS24_04455 [Chlamydiae bacterium SM23_39]|nr:MAG: hypothetical protein AMS24_04455 [Chlamydiae bacterium SM23_39]